MKSGIQSCSLLAFAPLTMLVSVTPGHSAVAVTPVPFSSSDRDSVSERTKALVAA